LSLHLLNSKDAIATSSRYTLLIQIVVLSRAYIYLDRAQRRALDSTPWHLIASPGPEYARLDQVVAKIEEETDIELHRVENRGAEFLRRNVVRFYVSLRDYFKSGFCHNLTFMQLLHRYFLMVFIHYIF
jgi:hypothetical protein